MVTKTLAKGHRSITIPNLVLVIIAISWMLYKSFSSSITTIDAVFLLASVILLVFNVQFFRDPIRTPEREAENSIIAPADGVLFEIDSTTEPGTTIYRIRMRFWDVHVNYMPLNGTLASSVKKRGILLPILPFINKYSKNRNARQTLDFKAKEGFNFKVVQISGTLAYRTVGYGKPNQYFEKAAKIGMIRYGSETDLHLPTALTEPEAVLGQKVKAGKTIIAKLKETN